MLLKDSCCELAAKIDKRASVSHASPGDANRASMGPVTPNRMSLPSQARPIAENMELQVLPFRSAPPEGCRPYGSLPSLDPGGQQDHEHGHKFDFVGLAFLIVVIQY